MAGELVVEVRVEERMVWWRPLWQAVAGGPHLIVTGVVSVLCLVVMVVIAGAVLLTGRVPEAGGIPGDDSAGTGALLQLLVRPPDGAPADRPHPPSR